MTGIAPTIGSSVSRKVFAVPELVNAALTTLLELDEQNVLTLGGSCG